jgi:hypothetical protein
MPLAWVANAVPTSQGCTPGMVELSKRREFCGDLVSAARNRWLAMKDDALVKKNFGRFVRYWPDGISPYIIGTALIG